MVKEKIEKRNHLSKPDDEIIKIPGAMSQIISEEQFRQVQQRMYKNRIKFAGSYKAKEIYLLSGLITCGQCGSSMVGNTKYCGRNKIKYVTYRCSNRDRTKKCMGKEIRREYIEQYIINQLYEKIFSDKAIKHITLTINNLRNKGKDEHKMKIQCYKKSLHSIEKEINNILTAISQGFIHKTLKDKLTSLEKRKTAIEIELNNIKSNKPNIKPISENEVRMA